MKDKRFLEWWFGGGAQEWDENTAMAWMGWESRAKLSSWRSVEEDPPPEGEYVHLLGYFGSDIKYKDMADYDDRIVIGCWDESAWYIPRFHCDVPVEVSHWMPLPDQLEEDE